jgi:hypothetical protein
VIRPATLGQLATWALGLFTLLVGLASLTWPFAWDPGIFTWVGDTIRHGGLPYRDAWDAKGPFAYYAYALVQRSEIPAMWPVRLLDLAFVAAGAVAVAAIVRRFVPGNVGALTAFFLVLTHYSTDFYNTAQPDAWIAAMSAIAMAALLRPDQDRRLGLTVLAALLVGTGLLQKPTFAIWLPLPALAIMLSTRPLAWRLPVAALLSVVTLVPAAIVAAWFQSRGALPQLIEGYLSLNLELSRNLTGSVWRAAAWSLVRVQVTPLGLALPAALLGITWLWKSDRRASLLLLAWAAGAWVSVAAQRRFFPYHWQPVFWSVAPLAGIGFSMALRRPEGSSFAPARALAGGLLALLVALLVIPLQVRVRDAADYLTGRMSLETYVLQFLPDETAIVRSDMALARYLQSHSLPEDRVIIWDSPLAGALAQRRAPTRIGFFFPLVNARSASAGPIAPGPVQQRIRAEYLAGLDDPRTKFVAVTRGALAGVEASPRKSIPALFPEFGQALADSWSLVDSAGDYLVFTRRAR